MKRRKSDEEIQQNPQRPIITQFIRFSQVSWQMESYQIFTMEQMQFFLVEKVLEILLTNQSLMLLLLSLVPMKRRQKL